MDSANKSPDKENFSLEDFDFEQINAVESLLPSNLDTEIQLSDESDIQISAQELDNIGFYIKEIGELPLLTREQEFWLGVEVQAGKYVNNFGRLFTESQKVEALNLVIGDFCNHWQRLQASISGQNFPDYDWGAFISDIVLQKVKEIYGRPDNLFFWISELISQGDTGKDVAKHLLHVYICLLCMPLKLMLQFVGNLSNSYDAFLESFSNLRSEEFINAWNLDQIVERSFDAKEKLVISNLRLVISVAKRYKGQGLEFEDLIQFGNLGLLRAIDKFDPVAGFRFSTYSYWWIMQAVTRAIADFSRNIRLPVHFHDQIRNILRIRDYLHQILGRLPTSEEIAKEHGSIKPENVNRAISFAREPLSLDEPLHDDKSSVIGDYVKDDFDLDRYVILALLQEDIKLILEKLQYRERKVIELRYGLDGDEPKTLEEIGQILGVTRERIRQLENQALGRIRQLPISRSLKVYLDK